MAARRIEFANQLRGVAALSVATSHLVGIYWALPGFVAASTFSPVQPGPPPALYRIMNTNWFEPGPFGVALFFLISGLVIPFSLKKHTRWTFLLARILRIYPTFIAALLLEMLVLYAAARYWHHPFGESARAIITNGLLINSLTGFPVIDFVNWTLAIEVVFYLLVFLMAGPIGTGRVAGLLVVAFLMTGANVLLSRHFRQPAMLASPVLYTFSVDSPYLIFMFIGVMFNFHHDGKLRLSRMITAIGLLTVLFLVSWRFCVLRPEFPAATINYLYAIILFGALYWARDRIPSFRPLDAMAAISFPFYLIHAIVGFSVIKFLMLAWHANYDEALAAAVAVILAVASLLHQTVERTTITMGHRLAGKGQGISPWTPLKAYTNPR